MLLHGSSSLANSSTNYGFRSRRACTLQKMETIGLDTFLAVHVLAVTKVTVVHAHEWKWINNIANIRIFNRFEMDVNS